MVNKTLLYKHEFINIDKNSLPKFSPEEIGHILLNIEKGIIKTPSLVEIEKKLEDIILLITPLKSFRKLFEEAKLFRTTGKFSMDYEPLRNKFITYIFSLIKQGILHRKIEGEELDLYLTKYFRGFPLLMRILKKVR